MSRVLGRGGTGRGGAGVGAGRAASVVARSHVPGGRPGTELIKKVALEEGEEKELCFGLTFPLLTKADGRKFGKSEDGAVWLTPGAYTRGPAFIL